MKVIFPCANSSAADGAVAAGMHDTAGYLAIPRAGAGPGVVVFQEWWGLVPHIERMCDRLAEAGFTALAPDLYSGRSTTDPDEAGRLMMALQVPAVAADAGGAIAFLRKHPACSSLKVGVTGFCLGGQVALFAACTFPDEVGACVNFYGIPAVVQPDVTKLRAPVLGLFAEKDTYVDAAGVSGLAAKLRAAGKPFEFKTYGGVDHAFMNETRPEVYDAPAAAEAWSRTLDFFRAHVN